MSLDALPAPSFTGADLRDRVDSALEVARATEGTPADLAALDARVVAAELEAAAARRFASVAALLADATLAYGTGSRAVVTGDAIEAGGHRYAVAAEADATAALQTPSLVRFNPQPGPDGSYSAAQWGATADGATDDTAAIQDALDWIAARADGVRPALVLPPGIVRITAPLAWTAWGMTLKGAGKGRMQEGSTLPRSATAILYDGAALAAATQGALMPGSAAAQARGIAIEDLTIRCQGLANGIFAWRTNLSRFERLYIDKPLTGIFMEEDAYSNTISGVEVYDPTTGGIDLRKDCHSVKVRDCAFNGNSAGANTPSYGVRVAQVANCSLVSVEGCNFDFYRCTKHVDVATDVKGFRFEGNYIECKGDGVTAQAVYLGGGAGIVISGNRISSTDSPTPTTINYGVYCAATCEDVAVIGNYFSGFDAGCIGVQSGALNVFAAGNARNGLTEIVDLNATSSSFTVADGTARGRISATKGLSLGAPVTHVISGGTITLTGGSYIRADTEASAAADDLDRIDGAFEDGQLLWIESLSSSRDVTVRDVALSGTGNIQLSSAGTSFALDFGRDKLCLIWNARSSQWEELSRANND